MKKINLSNMVLRYYIGFENAKQRFEILMDFLKRSGIRRVILFSAPFAEVSSIIPEEYYKRHAEFLRPYVQELKAMGVETGINMLFTNGHCFYADESEFGFRRAVTLDGQPSRGSVCMRERTFLEYVKRIYKYYASLNPSVIFTDDDIRMISMGQFICFCPEHIQAISKRVGKNVDLDEIRSSIFSDTFEDNAVKNAVFEQFKEDVEFIISQIADSVHEISPNTEIGIMTTSYPEITADRDLKEFFEKLKDSKNVTRIRTGMNYYREGDYNSIPGVFLQPVIQRNFIDNPDVQIQPEIENDTYGFYQKSNSITNMQLLWCLTNGFRNMQLNLFDFDMPVFNYEEITGMFSDNINYYNKIAELIPEGYRTDGIEIYAHPKALKKRRTKGGELFFGVSWYNWLSLLGMPISSKAKDSDFRMLVGDDIYLASDDEIDSMLKKGAVIDLRAAEALFERGYGSRIGVLWIKKIEKIFAGERFTDDDINGEFKKATNSHYFCSTLIEKETAKEITYPDDARILSIYINHHKEKVCDGVAAYENENGERFVILPYTDIFFTYFTNVNHKRRRQLINGFEWIARKRLPVCVDNEKMCVNINRFEKRNILTLFNLASDDVSKPKLRYAPIGTLKYIDKSGDVLPLKSEIANDVLVIDKEVRSAGVLIVIDELQ